MKFKRLASLAAAALLGLILCACAGGGSQRPEGADTAPKVQPGADQLQPEASAAREMSAQELRLAQHDMNAALLNPRYAAPQVKAQQPLKAGPRGISAAPGLESLVLPSALPSVALRDGRAARAFTEDQLIRDAADFDPLLPQQQVSTVSGEPQASFDSAADLTLPVLADCAYATYSFVLPNAAFEDIPQSIGLLWAEDETPSRFYVALSNWDTQRWDWYEGGGDSVVSLPTLYSHYRVDDGLLLALVLVADSAPRRLEFVQIGAREIKGLGGMAPETPEGQSVEAPELHFAGKAASFVSSYVLPSYYDRLGYPYDQGEQLSCTCCAVAGAENYELSRNYSPLWYPSAFDRRVSPKWIYRKTLFGNCSVGRPPEQALDLMKNTGGALERWAPFNLNCDDDWDAQVTEWDRERLKIENWRKIRSRGQSGIDEIKAYLSTYERPIIFLVTVDENFKDGDFSNNAVWTWNDWAPNVINWHTMLIVGWDDGIGAFKVRNSWGYDWGDGGECWVSYDTFKGNAWIDCFFMWDDYDEAVADWFGVNAQTAARPPANVYCSKGAFLDKIKVQWDAVPNATKYYVYRDDFNGYIAEVPAGTTVYDDMGIGDVDAHPYWVQTVVGSAEGPYSTSPAIGWKENPGGPDILNIRGDTALTAVKSGSTIKLYADLHNPSGGGGLNFNWSFPAGTVAEGDSSADAVASVTFNTAGTHACNLHLSNSFGSDDYAFSVTVLPPPQHPVANLSGPSSARKNRVVYFDASASTCDSGQSIVSYYWDFNGDGYYEEETSNPSIGHIFAFWSSYDVQVVVRDSRGLYSFWSTPLSVVVSSFDEYEDNDSSGGGLTMSKLKGYKGSIGPYSGCDDGDTTDWWVIPYHPGFTHYVKVSYDSAQISELTVKCWREDLLMYQEDICSDGVAEIYFPGTETASSLYLEVTVTGSGGADYYLSFDRFGEL